MSSGVSQSRRRFLATSLVTLAAAPLGMLACSGAKSRTATAVAPSTIKDNSTMQQITPVPASLPVEGRLPSLDGATGWLNSRPLTPDGLRGQVVLVELLTYTCINWLRTLPYVRAWSEKYADHGLAVLGVHTPEFAFEKDVENVRCAMTDLRIPFPVAIDNDYVVWRAFKNNYWPAFYFVDAMGQIRYHRFGEGEYERSEMVLQQLLADTGRGGFDRDVVSVEGSGVEAAPDWESLRSPETYVGYQRTERLASPGGVRRDRRHVYSTPAQLSVNRWALAGDWTVGQQGTVLHEAGGRIAYRFQARDLHFVMGPAARGASVRFRVLLEARRRAPHTAATWMSRATVARPSSGCIS